MNPNTPSSLESDLDILAPPETNSVYWEELAILEFTEQILGRLEALGLTKTQLAEKLQANPAFISKLIRGTNNFTLRTMVRIARALESELRFHLQPAGADTVWVDYSVQHSELHANLDFSLPDTVCYANFRPTAIPQTRSPFDETVAPAA